MQRIAPALAALLLGLACLASSSFAAVIYVKPDGNDANNGLSWEQAKLTVAGGLSAATDGDQVWVAAGTYMPDRGVDLTRGDRSASFGLINGVAIYGGFAGTELALDERDPGVNPTILSGDLNSDDGANFAHNGENSYHVVTANGVDKTAVLDGFTITGGNADGTGANRNGAGMLLTSASPTISNCSITWNEAGYGGGDGAGVHCYQGGIYLTHCEISHNRCGDGAYTRYSRGGDGAGLCAFYGNVTMLHCQIHDNRAGDGGIIEYEDGGGDGGDGGAGGGALLIRCDAGTFINCRFERNGAGHGGSYPDWGRGGFGGNGGGIRIDYCNEVRFSACLFVGNAAGNGGDDPEGGLGGSGGGAFSLMSDVIFSDCTFTGNSCGAGGDGSDRDGQDGEGRAIAFFEGTNEIHNSVLYDNSLGYGEVAYDGSAPSLRYSCVLGGYSGDGNIDFDPQFVGPSDGDYRLAPGSPCIDAADNTAVPDGITADLDGNPRFIDDPKMPDTGNGTPPIVDMGAYEYQGLPIQRGDVNCDGGVNFDDIDPFVTALISRDEYESQYPDCNYLNADVNQDGDVDFNDIDGFIECLINGGCP